MKKCWPFFHDWEMVESITYSQLRENITCKLKHSESKDKDNPCRPPLRIIAEDENRLVKKICLKCGAIQDNITPQKAEIIEGYYELKARRERKRKLLEKVLDNSILM